MNLLQSRSWISMYFNINFAEIYNNTFDWNSFEYFFNKIKVNQVKYCYIKINSVQAIPSIKTYIADKSFLEIFEKIVCKLPNLEECTFECLSSNKDIKAFVSLLDFYIDNNVFISKEVAECISRTSTRVTMKYHAYQKLFYSTQKKEYLHNKLEVDISWTVNQKNFNYVCEEVIACSKTYGMHSPSHVSFVWNIPGMHIGDDLQSEIHDEDEHLDPIDYWGSITELLHVHDFYPYQIWHFAKKEHESRYLSSIYAMESYLGVNMGEYEEVPIWTEKETDTDKSYVGVMGNDYQIEWDEVDFDLELDMRLMQSKSTVYLSLPLYIRHMFEQHNTNLNRYLQQMGFIRLSTPNREILKHVIPQRKDRETWLFPLEKSMSYEDDKDDTH